MKLDSVREVKNAMFSAAMMAASSPIDWMNGVALGISKKDRQNVLAVRIPVGYGHSSILTDMLSKLVKPSEMDVQVVEPLYALPDLQKKTNKEWRHTKNRPVFASVSCGHPKVSAGTIGCFVMNGNDVFVLTNSHVGANCGDARANFDPLLQQGVYDGGVVGENDIAILSRFVDLKSSGNKVDGCIAKMLPNIKYEPYDMPEVGKIAKPMAEDEIEVGMVVVKSGRTTGKTISKVSAIELDSVKVNYGKVGVLSFDHQLEISGKTDNPSLGGDSGSCWLMEGTNRVLGLNFAGSPARALTPGRAIANYISDVLEQLNVEVMC